MNIIRFEFDKISANYGLEDEYFPRELKPFILDIVSILSFIKLPNKNKRVVMLQLIKRMDRIDMLLNKFNIVLDLSMTCQLDSHGFITFMNAHYSSSDLFHDELLHIVKYLSDTFKIFSKFGFTIARQYKFPITLS